MKRVARAAIVALFCLASTAPAYASDKDLDRRYPHPRNQPGENAYRMACAVMWMLGYTICLELPGAPKPNEKRDGDRDGD